MRKKITHDNNKFLNRIYSFKKVKVTKNSGQALMEFLLLFVIIFAMSFTILKVANNNLGKIWIFAVKKIASKDTSQNSLRLR
jgi:hypothetical protein